MSPPPPSPPSLAAPSPALAEHWRGLARASAIEPGERLLIALSGGADSVFLLHLVAAAVPRTRLLAVHVDHGLRGAESEADARFCEALCERLGVPFERHTLALDPGPPSLEARARRARYACLARSARRSGHTTLLTGHHADDALETLLLRWMRGSSPAGLYGPRRDGPPPHSLEHGSLEGPGGPALRLVRPLFPLRREEVRVLARAHGIAWREDRSNADRRHARNRVRHDLLPTLDRWCGEEGLDHLRSFAEAAERLETELARATAELTWSPLPSRGTPGPGSRRPQRIARAALMRLPRMLLRRVLWRLVTTGVGTAPGSSLLEDLLEDLLAGRCVRHTLPLGWSLVLRSDELLLVAPAPGPPHERLGVPPQGLVLQVPGAVRLADGSRITATLVHGSRPEGPPRAADVVELDAEHLPRQLAVRLPGPGDRFHPLGAPGSKRLSRYLADRRLPREERSSVPLVLAGDEIVWVPGFAPAESRRVRSGTLQRVRLTIEPGGPSEAPEALLGAGTVRSR